MKSEINVFILAAGLGERLRPVTEYIPKPLLPVLGKPVLRSILEQVSSLSMDKLGINVHYKKETITAWINGSAYRDSVTVFPEDTILGTGGALKNAELFLGDNAFLIHNSDVISDIDLAGLVEFHGASKNLITLAVHDYQRFNTVVVDDEGLFNGIKGSEILSGKQKLRAFTGIAVYEPDFLQYLPSGVSGIVDAWIKANESGQRVGTYDVSGCYWRDIGSLSSYASAVIDALRADGETVFIHHSAEDCRNITMDGYVVLEKQVKLGKGASLRNCIVLPEGSADAGEQYENCILGPDFKIPLNENEILGISGADDFLLIGTGGSDRRYFRSKNVNKREVLMQSHNDDPDFERQIEYTRFFLKHGVPVPDLISVNPEERRAVFQDLGDLTLYSWLKCRREREDVENIYRQVLDALVLVHMSATAHIDECPLLKDRIFDYEYFRWETEYFIERFVMGVMNREVDIHTFEKEFHALAQRADSFPTTVIHRDFQSQNIMIPDDGTPRLIDYQGARIGPPGYDVSSILMDPYHRLDDDMREGLLNFYISSMKDTAGKRFNEAMFRQSMPTCRLQRHMQALGAYGFLSSVKGKKYFLKYVPEGLRLLQEDISLTKNEYPALYDLIMGLRDREDSSQ
jgi:NDP-sugar pyrophosphorylase family protein